MRRYAVVFSPSALNQVAILYHYIKENAGTEKADAFVGSLLADCRSLSTFPERGRRRDDIRPNLRTNTFARRVITAYSIEAEHERVVIHGIFHGGQDVDTRLREQVLLRDPPH